MKMNALLPMVCATAALTACGPDAGNNSNNSNSNNTGNNSSTSRFFTVNGVPELNVPSGAPIEVQGYAATMEAIVMSIAGFNTLLANETGSCVIYSGNLERCSFEVLSDGITYKQVVQDIDTDYYQVSFSLDGTSLSDPTTSYSNWVAYSAEIHVNGSDGRVDFPHDNSTNLEAQLTWSTVANSGQFRATLNSFEDDIPNALADFHVDYVRNTDGSGELEVADDSDTLEASWAADGTGQYSVDGGTTFLTW